MTDRESPRPGGPSPIHQPNDTGFVAPEPVNGLVIPEPKILSRPWPELSTVDWCYRFEIHLVGPTVFSKTNPCDSWQCPTCGPRRVGELSRHLAAKWFWEREFVFYAIFKQEALNRVSQRMANRPRPWVKVWWESGIVHMFSVRPITGSKPPNIWHKLSLQDAVDLLVNVVLTLPLVTKTYLRNGWEMKSKDSEYAAFQEDPELFWEAVDETVSDVCELAGRPVFGIENGDKLPHWVDLDLFIELLKQRLE